MELDYNKINETISNLKASIEYIDSVTDDLRKTTHTIHPLLREIKELESHIDSNKGIYSENIIDQLIKKKALCNKLSVINEVDLLFNQVIDDMYDFVQSYNFRPDKIKKYSDKEIELLYDFYYLERKTGFNKCIKILNEYFLNVSDCHLIELLNSQLQLTGLSRFYLKDDIVMSFYCSDLKELVKNLMIKSQFHKLKIVVNNQRGISDGLLSPFEMLKAIIYYFNRKIVGIQKTLKQNQIE